MSKKEEEKSKTFVSSFPHDFHLALPLANIETRRHWFLYKTVRSIQLIGKTFEINTVSEMDFCHFWIYLYQTILWLFVNKFNHELLET